MSARHHFITSPTIIATTIIINTMTKIKTSNQKEEERNIHKETLCNFLQMLIAVMATMST